MGLSHSPSIVTDGLVLCLDAANTRSYPKSGSSWLDLSGNGNNGTLTNGPTFSSTNGGIINFDGTNDYVSCGNVSFSGNNFSIEVVFEWDDFGTTGIGFLVAGNHEQLEIHTGGGAGTNGLRFIPYDYPNNSILDVPNMITSGINHIVFTAENNSYSKAYKNSSLVGTATTTSSVNLASTQSVNIGRRTNNSYIYDGKIHYVRIYNKTLSADEVRRNYLATKSRFNL